MDLLRSIFKGDKVIWIIFLFLCLISIVEVFSAASTLTYKSGDHWGPITQHSIILMMYLKPRFKGDKALLEMHLRETIADQEQKLSAAIDSSKRIRTYVVPSS